LYWNKIELITNKCATGIKAKVENKGQYDQYLEELKPLREELGVSLKEDLYPEEAK
jgi:cytochrome c oxidase subunit 5a